MKKTAEQKKLQLSKIKIANLSKSKQKSVKGAGICLTSYDETSCPMCSRQVCEVN